MKQPAPKQPAIKQPTLKLTPLTHAAKAHTASVVPCLVTLTAPAAFGKASARVPLNLGIVLDASPSMRGRPLDEAKLAALRLIDRLDSSDRVALVVYSSSVKLLVPSVTLDSSARAAMLLAIASIEAFGSATALHAGWLEGANAIAPHATSGVHSRVLLLSDGQANVGQLDPSLIASDCARLLGEGSIATSTYGIGHQFNEDLMTRMAVQGGGHAFYASAATELIAYFETELAGLRATLGVGVKVEVSAKASSKPCQVTWRKTDATADSLGHRLSDLIAGASSWAVCDVAVPALAAGKSIVINVTATWVDPSGHSHRLEAKHPLPIRVSVGKTASQVAERVREVEAAVIQAQAASYAAAGNWAGVEKNLGALRDICANNAYLKGVTATLSAVAASGDARRLGKEALYGSNAMLRRQVAIGEDHTSMAVDPLGLRKAVQGLAAAPAQATTPSKVPQQ